MNDGGISSADWRAFDSIDTAYEAAGFLMAQNLLEAIGPALVPIVLLSGTAVVIYQALTRDDLKRAIFYFFYVMVLYFLLEPAEAHRVPLAGEYAGAPLSRRIERGTTIKAPRLLVWINSGADYLIGRAGEKTDAKWGEAFKMARLTQILAEARIGDERLRREFRFFTDYCYVPALAKSGKANGPYALNPFLDRYFDDGKNDFNLVRNRFNFGGSNWLSFADYGGLAVDLEDGTRVECRTLAERVREGLARHVQSAHLGAIREIASSYGSDLTRTAYLYMERVIYNELFGGTPASSLEKKFTRYVPSAQTLSEKVIQRATVGAAEGGGTAGGLRQSLENSWEMAKEGIGYGFAWLTKEMSPIYARYMVVMMAPVIYGIVVMILAAVFPAVALFGLYPFRWQAIANYVKIFVSVKMWPLFWTMIGRIESAAMAGDERELFSTHEVSASSVALAAAAMYVVVPALCYMVATAATSAAAAPFAGARDAGSLDGMRAMKEAGAVVNKGAELGAARGAGSGAGGGGGAAGRGRGAARGAGGARAGGGARGVRGQVVER